MLGNPKTVFRKFSKTCWIQSSADADVLKSMQPICKILMRKICVSATSFNRDDYELARFFCSTHFFFNPSVFT